MKYKVKFNTKYGVDYAEVEASSAMEATDKLYDDLMDIYKSDDIDVEFISIQKMK